MQEGKCGPNMWGDFFKPPRHIFFEASCKLHDGGYEKGGNELRRFECDVKFLGAMLNDCQYSNRKILDVSWAVAYFFAVRLFGWAFFNYT